MNILIFTDYDLDGAGSALFIKWLYKSKITDLIIIEATESSIIPELKNREHTLDHFDKVFVLDLDLGEEAAALVDRDNFVIIDHHVPHNKVQSRYKKAKTVIEEYGSCVGLMHKKFKGSLDLTDAQVELINYIDDYDSYRLEHKDSLKLNAIYKTYNNPKTHKFIEAFEDGFRPYTIQEKNSIKLFVTRFKEQLDNQVFIGTIKDYTAVSIIADFAISEVANYIISKHNADIGFVVNLNTKTVSFRRSKTSEVDVSILARNLCSGNGSPAAAGGKITEQFAALTKNFMPC